METFEEYLKTIQDKEKQQRLLKIWTWIEQEFPQLEKRIAWNQPMYTDHGTFIIGFSVSKPHMAVSPEAQTMKHFSDEIQQAGYSLTSQLFRIKWNEEVDYSLLKRIIQYNIEEKKECTTFWRS